MNNRPIKLRAWDNLKKQWLKKKVYHLNPHFDENGFGEFRLNQHPEGYTIYQFTGAADKLGISIFDGDIVLWDQQDPFDCTPSKAKKVVGWNQRCMQFRLYNHPTEIGQSGGEEFLAEDVVVIGNIFDWKNEECRYLLDESVKNKL